MSKSKMEVSPAKLLVDDLDYLRKLFRETLEKYAQGVEAEILHIQESVNTEGSGKKVSSSRNRDFRDMTTSVRKLNIKSEKGKRKDLKKIDLLVKDLRDLSDTW